MTDWCHQQKIQKESAAFERIFRLVHRIESGRLLAPRSAIFLIGVRVSAFWPSSKIQAIVAPAKRSTSQQ